MYKIRDYQHQLKILGFFEGQVDGIYTPALKDSIKRFQKSKGIEDDGIIGPVTWSKLFPEKVIKTDLPDLPWIKEALRVKGLHEVKNNKDLYIWLRSDGSSVGDPSKIPWCGDYVETAINLGLPKEEYKEPLASNHYWARNWVAFGKSVIPQYGAILVFSRKGGGHVGFYVGEDKNYFHVLGGNQSNSITISRIAKSRCIAVRYPLTFPENKVKVNMSINGKLEVSSNEE